MRTIIITALMLVGFIITSCKKDNDVIQQPSLKKIKPLTHNQMLLPKTITWAGKFDDSDTMRIESYYYNEDWTIDSIHVYNKFRELTLYSKHFSGDTLKYITAGSGYGLFYEDGVVDAYWTGVDPHILVEDFYITTDNRPYYLRHFYSANGREHAFWWDNGNCIKDAHVYTGPQDTVINTAYYHTYYEDIFNPWYNEHKYLKIDMVSNHYSGSPAGYVYDPTKGSINLRNETTRSSCGFDENEYYVLETEDSYPTKIRVLDEGIAVRTIFIEYYDLRFQRQDDEVKNIQQQ